jgi:hypothetical protein
MAGTLATGTVTSSGVAVGAETITIGSVTYTWRAALTGAKATGTLTTTNDFTAGETVTINGVTYTMRATLSSPAQAFEVLIGANAAASLDNLKSAINGGSTAFPTAANGVGEGSTYSVGTYRNPFVTATTNANDSQVIEAREFGTAAHQFNTIETCAAASWGGAVMSGGVANAINELFIGAAATNSLDNLKAAINGTGTPGTEYSVGTPVHPEVTGDAKDATTLVVTARDMAVGEDIGTTETMTNWAWGATTLASGVADQNAVNATAKAQTSGGKNV